MLQSHAFLRAFLCNVWRSAFLPGRPSVLVSFGDEHCEIWSRNLSKASDHIFIVQIFIAFQIASYTQGIEFHCHDYMDIFSGSSSNPASLRSPSVKVFGGSPWRLTMRMNILESSLCEKGADQGCPALASKIFMNLTQTYFSEVCMQALPPVLLACLSSMPSNARAVFRLKKSYSFFLRASLRVPTSGPRP